LRGSDPATGVLEDYERARVPSHHRRGSIGLTLVVMSLSVAIPSLLLGSALVVGMGLRRAFFATIFGTIVGAPICMLASHVGTRSRLSTAMTLKFAFGSVGSRLISAVIALDMFCWFAVNTEIFGTSLRDVVASIWHTLLGKPVLCVVAGIMMTALTIFGYQAVERFAFLAVPSLVIMLFTYVAISLFKAPFHEITAAPALGKPMSNWVATSLVAGTFLSVAVLLPDFTRYAKSVSHTAASVFVGLCFGFPPFVLIGAYLTAVSREPDFVKMMLLRGWGPAAVVIIVLTCWVHMNSCLYSASLNLAAIVPRVSKWQLTVAAGLGGTFIALFGIVRRYVPFLIILSVVLPPITAVYTADYLLRKRVYRLGELTDLDRFRGLSLLSLFLGIATGFMTTARDDVGLGLFHLTYLPALDSFLAAFVSHLLLGKLAQHLASSDVEALSESTPGG
jgi:cytosine permease